MSRRAVARAAVAMGLTLGLSGAVVSLAPAASAAPALALSRTTIDVGETVTVSGGDCFRRDDPINQPYALVNVGAFVGQVQANPDGTWSQVVDVGAQLGPGDYPVNARCAGFPDDFLYVNTTITVAGTPIRPWWETPAPRPPARVPQALPEPPPAAPAPTPPPAPATSARTTPSPPPAPPAPTTAPEVGTTAAPGPAVAMGPAPGCAQCALFDSAEPLRAGQRLMLTYTGFAPGEPVTVVMRSTPVTLGTFTADAAGVVTAELSIPSTAEDGAHTLTISGAVTGDLVVDFELDGATAAAPAVVAPASADAPFSLPLVLGVVVVLLGAGGLVFRRQRRVRAPGVPATNG